MTCLTCRYRLVWPSKVFCYLGYDMPDERYELNADCEAWEEKN